MPYGPMCDEQLQWGRCFAAAETEHPHQRTAEERGASMGPLLRSSGDVAHAVAVVWRRIASMGPLLRSSGDLSVGFHLR